MTVRAIRAPIKVESENKARGFGNAFATVHRSKKQRQDVGAILSQLPRKPSDQHAFFVVSLTRFSAGYLDDDNLRGAFKAVRDEVAYWLGVDDGGPRIRFEYHQEPAPLRHFGIRIAIEDGGQTPGHERDHGLGIEPPKDPKKAAAEKAKRDAKKVEQRVIVWRECYAVLPWDQDGGDPVTTPLSLSGENPPKVIAVHTPAVVLSGAASVKYAPGKKMFLWRVVGRVEGQEVWLYVDEETKKGGEYGRGNQRDSDRANG